MKKQHPVYAIAQLKILNFEDFHADYAEPLQPINKKYGVQVLSASKEVIVLEGDYQHNLTVILKFPSMAHQQAWYQDEDYQHLIKRRQALTDQDQSRLVVLPHLA